MVWICLTFNEPTYEKSRQSPRVWSAARKAQGDDPFARGYDISLAADNGNYLHFFSDQKLLANTFIHVHFYEIKKG